MTFFLTRVRVQSADRVLWPGDPGRDPPARERRRKQRRRHLALLDLALDQLPQEALDGELLARSDSAGASHELADACRECDIRFSFGYPLTGPGADGLGPGTNLETTRRIEAVLHPLPAPDQRCDEGLDVGTPAVAILERFKPPRRDRAIPTSRPSDRASHRCDRVGVTTEAHGEPQHRLDAIVRQRRVERGRDRSTSIGRTS